MATPPKSRWLVRLWNDPWGQMAIYMVIFAVLGFAVVEMFSRIRGPQRHQYEPWDAPANPATSVR